MSERGSTLSARLQLFPVTVQVEEGQDSSRLSVAGICLDELAELVGTPYYLYDQVTLDAALEAYQQSLHRNYPGSSGVTYAGKAYLSTAMAQWVKYRQISLDCSSAGEIFIASQAGLPRQKIVSHGVNKSPADLQAALQHAGSLVVDNLNELDRLISLQARIGMEPTSNFPDLWLRLKPGVSTQTHSHIQTGQVDSKFGLDAQEFTRAVGLCQNHHLPLIGLHFHLGSHLHTPQPLVTALEIAIELIQECRLQTGWLPRVICPGGGWGVPYHETDLPHLPIENLVAALASTLVTQCQAHQLPLFHLQLEPGRSLVARAGVAVYRLGAIKHTPSRRYLFLDGGMADNPRPALYQARYTALPVNNPFRQPGSPAWLAGPYCESGDLLLEDILLPEMQPGELVAVPVSGAYQLSMSSNYNGACRPAVLWLNDQQAQLVQARETASDLVRRDLPLTSMGH